MKKYIIILLTILSIACNNEATHDHSKEETFYTCSMDPQVISNKPGKCPICRMDLTPVQKNASAKKGEIQLSDQQIRLGNIHSDTIKNGAIGTEQVLTATLNFDQMQTGSIASRVMGRIEKLYFKATGDKVNKGAPIFEIYSEELNNAKQEYLLAIERKKVFGKEAMIDLDQLLSSAKNKLLLWGMSEAQINSLERSGKASPTTTFYSNRSGIITSMDIREGEYVMEGGTVMQLADLSTLWAEAQVYTTQLSSIERNAIAEVRIPGTDLDPIKGKIEFINPEINNDTRINLVRVAINNPGMQLKPGLPAYVVIRNPVKNTLSLPIDAVIRDGDGATVWIRTKKHDFKSVPVKTGIEQNDRIEILSGLKEGDVVVTSGVYLLNSEYVFRSGTN